MDQILQTTHFTLLEFTEFGEVSKHVIPQIQWFIIIFPIKITTLGVPDFHWHSMSSGRFEGVKVHAIPAEPGTHRVFLVPCATAWNHLDARIFKACFSLVIQCGLMRSVRDFLIPVSVRAFGCA